MSTPASIRVLLVEPHDDTRELYVRGLTLEGLDVVEAHDWASALVAFSTHEPAIVVSEIRLPDLGDVATLKIFPAAGVPVIALTTAPEPQHHMIRDAGVTSVLMKPCSWEDVAEAIRVALEIGPRR